MTQAQDTGTSGEAAAIDSEEIRDEGIEGRWPLGLRDRVRFAEIDMFGHSNHTAYLEWFENARSKYFPSYGLTDFGPDSNRPVMRSIHVEYSHPLALNSAYIVTAKTTNLGRTSFTMAFEVWSAGTRAARCEAVFVLLDADMGEPVPIPGNVRSRLERDLE